MNEPTISPIAPMMLDLPKVAATLSLCPSTVQNLLRAGEFPKPRQISGRRVAWLTTEIAAWAHARPTSDILPPPNTGAPKPR
ncbi:MAG: AlpA family phage regulatory protein [Simplicispira sp.]|nr:AlpA family phage regulatory protein [Simplicispira sp.]